MKTVRLENGTIGELLAGESENIGDTVRVKLHNENGIKFDAKGVLAEILIE